MSPSWTESGRGMGKEVFFLGMDWGNPESYSAWILGEVLPGGTLATLESGIAPPQEGGTIVCDDPLDEEEMTPERRAAVLWWYEEPIQPKLLPSRTDKA